MTSRTITARSATLAGYKGGALYTAGEATVDDATSAGKSAIEFAKRQGWAVSGAIAAAVDLTPAQGEQIERWTLAECKAYLDAAKVQYPSNTSVANLRKAIRDAFEVKAQGGAAANSGAGHTSETIPPEGAGPVTNPDKPDDAATAAKWKTPQSGNVTTDTPIAITVQPSNQSKVAPATATFSVTATGTSPTYQWYRQAKGVGDFVAIDGATAASYTTPATSVGTNAGDKYHVIVDNADSAAPVTSSDATLTVT